eukprot:TRINITY_DN1131_c0_g2_i1.p2 TRINITY_DN1131_c0_g2~~TRINITY_DN1131_c0_g2_i1.p2  ORF type:complete len:346 (-),score=88.04 TRINITY_DN1131_c0_g2_i1:484-1521(-)
MRRGAKRCWTLFWLGTFGVQRAAGAVVSKQHRKLEDGGQATAKRKVVAFAITLTSLSDDEEGAAYIDAIEVLRKSIDLSCAHSDYQCKFVALLDPEVPVQRRSLLTAHGWRVLERGLPLDLDTIETDLRERLKTTTAGCCGAKELIKLWAFTLTEYHRVIHVDIDAMVLQPLDEWIAKDVDLVYTEDAPMASNKHNMPVQGGFLLLRPSLEIFQTLVEIVRKGDFTGDGWNKSGIGWFWGGDTIQGLLAYYYRAVKPERAFIADPCVVNNMLIDDCRTRDPLETYSYHFTLCQKPWKCLGEPPDYCRYAWKKWFEIRDAAIAGLQLEPMEACVEGRYRPFLTHSN